MKYTLAFVSHCRNGLQNVVYVPDLLVRYMVHFKTIVCI